MISLSMLFCLVCFFFFFAVMLLLLVLSAVCCGQQLVAWPSGVSFFAFPRGSIVIVTGLVGFNVSWSSCGSLGSCSTFSGSQNVSVTLTQDTCFSSGLFCNNVTLSLIAADVFADVSFASASFYLSQNAAIILPTTVLEPVAEQSDLTLAIRPVRLGSFVLVRAVLPACEKREE
jgi:hypothetical protein